MLPHDAHNNPTGLARHRSRFCVRFFLLGGLAKQRIVFFGVSPPRLEGRRATQCAAPYLTPIPQQR